MSEDFLIMLSKTSVVDSPRFSPGFPIIPAKVPNTDVTVSIIRNTKMILIIWRRAFLSFISWARLATIDVTRIGMTVIWKRFR